MIPDLGVPYRWIGPGRAECDLLVVFTAVPPRESHRCLCATGFVLLAPEGSHLPGHLSGAWALGGAGEVLWERLW